MTDVEGHTRLFAPTGIFALEEMSEEPFLQRLAITAVEMREVGIAVDLEPFLLRARAQVALEVSARMKTHAAPVAGREQGGLDVLKLRGACHVVIVVQPASLGLARRVGAILREFFLR